MTRKKLTKKSKKKMFLQGNTIRYIYSGIFAISFFLCLKITIPSLAESVDTLDSEITKKYQKIILQEPSNTNAHFNLGILYYRNSLFDEPVREIRKVHDI